jgi:hypothetical protein
MRGELGAKGLDIENVRGMFVANREALQAALDEIDQHGGTEQFLFNHGLARDVPDELRRSLLI